MVGIAVGIVLLLALGAAATPSVLPGVLPGVRGVLPWFPGTANCGTSTVVDVVTAPAVQPVVANAVAPLQGRALPDGRCLQIGVRAQDPMDTVASSAVLPINRAPQIWVSDSSLWTSRVDVWKPDQVGSLGTSPIVVATGSAARAKLGWDTQPPSWRQALDGTHPLSSPGLVTNADALLAMFALWQSAGQGNAGERAVGAAVLASGRGGRTPGEAGLELAQQNDPSGPLVISDEFSMVTANANSTTANLTAIYPTEGSPVLDFPILRIGRAADDPARAQAVATVLTALTGAQGQDAARAAGIRDADGTHGPQGKPGVGTQPVKRLAVPAGPTQAGFVARLTNLVVPSRILAAIDVSISMRTPVPGSGLTRVQLAGRAAGAAGELLTDASSVGLWAFAAKLDGSLPYRTLSPVAPLGAVDNLPGAATATTHRVVLNTELARLDRQISGGGTGLYATTLAAVRSVRSSFDPNAVNSVVLFTDGSNDDTSGPTLEQTVRQLTADGAANPNRPVQLIGIALGPTADLRSLQALGAAMGGTGVAFRADTPAELQQVVFNVLSHRR